MVYCSKYLKNALFLIVVNIQDIEGCVTMNSELMDCVVHETVISKVENQWLNTEKGRNSSATVFFIPAKKSLNFVKRSFDIGASLFLGILFLIPMLIIGLMIRIDSPGPVLFKQERLGKDGIPFILYKFRSMHLNAEANGPQWANKNDNRCTRIGRYLRSTRLDELPQLWNIFTGKMSFVGPRPEREYFYEKFEAYIPGFKNRLKVKPGLTGLAQVNGGYDLLPEEKIIFDMEYIQHRSVRMDLSCIFKTVKLIFTHEGAR